MKKNALYLSLLLLVSGFISLQADDIVSTAADQKDVAVTAYNRNLALVRDRRAISIPEGEQGLMFMDVAEQIRPETVALNSLSSPGSLTILEQNYLFDLMSPSKLLDKHVGKEVELVNFSKDTGFDRKKARLLSNNESPIYMIDGKIYLNHPGSVVVPEIPGNLVERPSLVWLLDNTDPKREQLVEVNYLTGGIQWNADYVVKLDKTDDNLDLQGWVTLNNNSGATYKNAQLKLIAGDINIAQNQPSSPMYERAFMMKAAAMDAGMQAESFGDFHLYTVPRLTTIQNNQTKQVNLLHASDIKAQKHYEYQGQNWYYFQSGAGTQKNQKVAVYLTFQNKADNGLGVPLPAGVMRVYQEDSTGALQFSGEDRIEHTPKNEEVKLKLGNAFDINVDRVQTAFDLIGGNRNNPTYESSHKITIRNHKTIPVVVDVIEPMSGKWQITAKSQDYTQTDSHTVRFSVTVPAEGAAELTYSVRVTNQ